MPPLWRGVGRARLMASREWLTYEALWAVLRQMGPACPRIPVSATLIINARSATLTWDDPLKGDAPPSYRWDGGSFTELWMALYGTGKWPRDVEHCTIVFPDMATPGARQALQAAMILRIPARRQSSPRGEDREN